MPTYDYRCNGCDHRFELFQSMKDSPKRKCPECGRNALERLIGLGGGIIFKGGGFYETDYRSDSYKKGAEAEKSASSGAPAGGSCACGKRAASECASSAKPAKSGSAKAAD